MGEWDRSKFSLCAAKTKTGEPCRMRAGQGTNHVGVGRCFRHGGCSPSQIKHALGATVQQRLHAEAQAVPEEEAQPHVILKRLLGKTAARLNWLDEELARNDNPAAARMFKEERQFLSWVAKLASEVKLEEVEANIRSTQAALMAKMVQEAAKRAGLDSRQVAALGVGLRAVAAEASGDTATAEAEAARLAELREQLAVAEQERIETAAQRLTGLVPASEIAPGEDTGWLEPPEPEREEDAAPEPEPPRRPPGEPEPEPEIRTNRRSDLPHRGDPLLGPF